MASKSIGLPASYRREDTESSVNPAGNYRLTRSLALCFLLLIAAAIAKLVTGQLLVWAGGNYSSEEIRAMTDQLVFDYEIAPLARFSSSSFNRWDVNVDHLLACRCPAVVAAVARYTSDERVVMIAPQGAPGAPVAASAEVMLPLTDAYDVQGVVRVADKVSFIVSTMLPRYVDEFIVPGTGGAMDGHVRRRIDRARLLDWLRRNGDELVPSASAESSHFFEAAPELVLRSDLSNSVSPQ